MSKPTEDPATEPQDGRYARLADAAQRVAESHAIFIAEHTDPGTEAICAQYVLRQELLWHDMAGEPDAVVRIAEAEQRIKAAAEAIDREDLKWGALDSPEEAEAFATAVLAVVQPEINQRDTEIRQLRAELTTSAGVAEQAWERNTALLGENARLRQQLAVEHEVIDHPRVLIGLAQHTTPRWHERYEDEHGRVLLVFPGIEGDGIHLATDPKGCDVSLGTVEAVVSALREAARRTTLTGPSRAAMLCLPADTPDHEMGV